MFRASLAVALALAITPICARAQLDVVVRDSAGRAVEGARVELWGTRSLIAARSTGADGVARYSGAEVVEATAGLVRRIGFAPARFSLASPATSVTVSLEALAFSVPTMTIRAVAESCPQIDEPFARALWEQAAARYAEPSLVGRFTQLEQHTGLVAEADVGIVDGQRVVTGSRAYTTAGMQGATSRIERRGYVYALRPIHQEEMLGAWQYPPIEAELTGHFAAAAFGERHTLRVVSARGGVRVVRYCAADRRQSGLDGTLRISESDGLLDARWRYWNPSPDREPAGGEATFAPASPTGETAPLLATSGLFWRRAPSGRFAQTWQRYVEWRFQDEAGIVENPSQSCRPPENYVVCSATRVRRSGGALLNCSMMPYHCADEQSD